ncbi:chitinase [Fusarium pseudocircinatum]|uniref:Chitinase n=1 Tax=Fusarium pseudocircinatum TaxID=56676 RepID=A0A8H5UPC4_9HYPO|nr:chitinase [Fusarium pseudocircinatum]
MTSSPRYPSLKPDCILILANLWSDMICIKHAQRLHTAAFHALIRNCRHFSTQQQLQRRSSEPAKMSWMDSWSRPGKSQATPAPFYLLPGGEATPYCHSCGRVISTRRTTATANTNTPAKYCSSRCRTQKPGKLDRELEKAFVKLLAAEEGRGDEVKKQAKGGKHKKGKNSKGDNRIVVPCSAAEELVFGPNRTSMEGENEEHGSDEEETNELEQTQAPSEPRSSEDMDLSGNIIKDDNHIDGDVLARMSVRSGTRIRPPQSVSEVNGSVGGEKGRAERIHETEAMLEKRRQGQKRAKEREMTKCAARRGVVFGFTVSDKGEKRLCEAVMAGKIVEPSFAKGDWAIRWRE